MNRPLRDPVLESAAQLVHAKGDQHISLYSCRYWAAEHRAQAVQIVEAAARQVDKLRGWGLIPSAARTMDESIDFAVDHVARAAFEFCTGLQQCEPKLKGMKFAELLTLAADHEVARQVLECARGEARVSIAAAREAWLAAAEQGDDH